ncbi:MAG TPA: GNAT family N-acetyltransferase [Rhodothermales bacterium]|nr:GNAT family N-acetyltransferase [Rhodothermales bacterium]
MSSIPDIETARLHLRPYTRDDVDVLHRLWTDPDIRRYLLDDEIMPRSWVAEEIEGVLTAFDEHGWGQWAVLPRNENTVIGFCGYRPFHKPPELQLLYGITPAYWGQGLAPEAAHAMMRYGFEHLHFDQIIASTDAPNAASIRVMEKTGMVFAKRITLHGLDTLYYVLNRSDFRAGNAPYRVI